MNDIMIDLETLGVHPESPIISIGAVQFDLDTGRIGYDFYREIDIKYYDEYPSFKVDYSTVKWWMEQSKEAQIVFTNGKISIYDALKDFAHFYHTCSPSKNVWSNGSGFDIVMMRTAYKITKLSVPWKYPDEKDVRTIVHLGKLKGIEKRPAKTGIKHNALDDARYQVEYCVDIWKRIKG